LVNWSALSAAIPFAVVIQPSEEPFFSK